MLICLLAVDVVNPFEETVAFTSILLGSFANNEIMAFPFASVIDTIFSISAPCASHTMFIPLNGVHAYVAASVISNAVFGSTKSLDVILTLGISLYVFKSSFANDMSVSKFLISV